MSIIPLSDELFARIWSRDAFRANFISSSRGNHFQSATVLELFYLDRVKMQQQQMHQNGCGVGITNESFSINFNGETKVYTLLATLSEGEATRLFNLGSLFQNVAHLHDGRFSNILQQPTTQPSASQPIYDYVCEPTATTAEAQYQQSVVNQPALVESNYYQPQQQQQQQQQSTIDEATKQRPERAAATNCKMMIEAIAGDDDDDDDEEEPNANNGGGGGGGVDNICNSNTSSSTASSHYCLSSSDGYEFCGLPNIETLV